MYLLRIRQLVPAQPTQDQEELPSPSVLGLRISVGGTQRWLVSRFIPPPIISDDEVLPNALNFGLEDEVWAADLLRQIAAAPASPTVIFGDDDGLFFVAVDDDSLPPMAFMRQWQYTYPNQPFIDDDPWTPFSTLGWDDEFWLTFPPMRYATGTAAVDDEVLANAVNIAVEEDFWSPIFTMTIPNPMQAVGMTDTEVWVVFVPPPPSKAKGLPLLGAGA